MSNAFPYSDNNKRYHAFDYYLRSKYGCKVAKITLNGMFNCPNRDGTVATGSCFFCSDRGSGDFAGDAWKHLLIQYDEQKAKILRKWPTAARFIAYFQANTNTHDTVQNLKKRFELFAAKEEVVAIAIGTRPDCLPTPVLDYLAELNARKPVWIEIGLQTVHDQTANIFNRAYPTSLFYEKVAELRKRNISVAVHLINSLPGETKEMMLESVKKVASLDVQTIKIHMLHIVKNSPWGLRYAAEKWASIMDMDTYVDLVVEQLKWIPEHIHIERLTGDPGKEMLITPLWTLNKTAVLNAIDAKMVQEHAYQGMNVSHGSNADRVISEQLCERLRPQTKVLCLAEQGSRVAQVLAGKRTISTKDRYDGSGEFNVVYADCTNEAGRTVQNLPGLVKRNGWLYVKADGSTGELARIRRMLKDSAKVTLPEMSFVDGTRLLTGRY